MFKVLQKNKRLVAGLIALALLIFIIYTSTPFISAFFGAAILAYIFYPLDRKLRRDYNLTPRMSALIILIISLIMIILPIIFIVNGLINQIRLLPGQIGSLKILKERVNEILPFDIQVDFKAIMNEVMPILTGSIRPIFNNLINAFLILFLLFFLLYYMIVYSKEIKESIPNYLPFSKENNDKIITKFKEVTNATVIGTFLIAVVQGGLLALNFYLLGIPNALFWGFVTAILSFIPIVGAPVIWVPTALLLLINGSLSKGIVLIVVGIFISTIDNFLRPMINEKFGSIHPVISIIGIYIGIYQFGIIGVFIGPLIVVYFVLFWNIYREQYVRLD